MDFIWIAVAFASGFLVKEIRLPPMVGYLIAGFGLHALGVQPDGSIQTLADLGVTLLLFTIGLKLNFTTLFKREIWLSATGHMGTIIGLTIVNCLILGYLGLNYFTNLDVFSAGLIGLAVSFSSTVCAVKILEEKGELNARHGKIAIGVLVIQDIVAVLFVTLSSGSLPSIWALGLFGLIFIKPLLIKLLHRCGHGELLPLAGFFLAISAGELFHLVGLEGHLGALVLGVILSGDLKSGELAKALLNFKDLFLIGFFLSIGFTALPTLDMIFVALIMAVALPVKTGLFFLWFTRLKLRSRTAFLGALSLSNYSEFGLIVCAAAVAHGLLQKEWLVIIALAVALSFVFSSILNINAHGLYGLWHDFLARFERVDRLPEDKAGQLGKAQILVIGMGRVGAGAYDFFKQNLKQRVCGIDVDRARVIKHVTQRRKVIVADAEDPDFWLHVDLTNIQLITLAMPNYLDILEVMNQLKHVGYKGKTACIATYEDQKKPLLRAGVDVVYNFYENAGAGFAEHSIHLTEES